MKNHSNEICSNTICIRREFLASLKIKDEEQLHKKNHAISKNISFNCEEHSQTATAAALLKSSRFTNLTHALIFAHSHVCSKMRVDILAETIYFRFAALSSARTTVQQNSYPL